MEVGMPVTVVNCKDESERVMVAQDLIAQSEGRWFNATFIKRTTGKTRQGQFRIGVARYVKGVGMNYSPKEHDLKSVWEANNKEGDKQEDAYRMIDLRTVNHLKVDGVEYLFMPQIQEHEPEKKKK
jgi:hypothetical protein